MSLWGEGRRRERKGGKKIPGLKTLIHSFCVNHILPYLAGKSTLTGLGKLNLLSFLSSNNLLQLIYIFALSSLPPTLISFSCISSLQFASLAERDAKLGIYEFFIHSK